MAYTCKLAFYCFTDVLCSHPKDRTVDHTVCLSVRASEWKTKSVHNQNWHYNLYPLYTIKQTLSWLVQLTRASTSSQLRRVNGILPVRSEVTGKPFSIQKVKGQS